MQLFLLCILINAGVCGAINKQTLSQMCNALFTNMLDSPRRVSGEDNRVCLVKNESFLFGKDTTFQEFQLSTCWKWASPSFTTYRGQKCIENTSSSVDLRPGGYDPKTTFHHDCEQGKLNLVKYILRHGLADINGPESQGRTPVMAAAWKGQLAVFDFLVSQGCNLSIVDHKNRNVLHVACIGGNADIVRKLIEQHNFDIETRGFRGFTPVMYAVQCGHIHVFNFLLNKGCSLVVVRKYRSSIFHIACQGGQVSMMKHLIKLKVFDIDIKGGKKENTPVMLAAYSGHLEVVKLLVDEGCKINAVNRRGSTVLHLACKQGQTEVVKYLMKLKAVDGLLMVTDKNGHTPLQLARAKHHAEIVSLLLGRL